MSDSVKRLFSFGRKRLAPWVPFALALLPLRFDCLAGTPAPQDLTTVSPEDLMNIQVTSVSKKEESLSKVGAAVFVLSSEDIRRSGATNIPDLLRLVPGVTVAQIDGNTWAITIRGFNATYANKVLVLIDGRSVYSPLTSGVNWDQIDVPLEDIDRIEVIRGPGGTIWGANAVNGVINIITKKAGETQGGVIAAGGGSHEAGRHLGQYGGQIGSAAWRAFASYADTMGTQLPGGGEASDSWHITHLGGRSDWAVSQRDNLTLQGDLAAMDGGDTSTGPSPDARLSSDQENALGRWTRTLTSGSDFTLQAYFDHYNRISAGVLSEYRSTFDLDFHHHLKISDRHDVIWGLGYRVTGDRTSGAIVSFSPPNRADNLFSAFAQDDISLNRVLSLTVGSKVEHNAYTGVEFEPSAQLVWRPNDRQQVWASAARAIRQPNRADVGVHVDLATIPVAGGGTGSLEEFGQPNQAAEQLRDFELGYRIDASRRLSIDIASFYGFWRNLSQTVSGTPYFASLPEPRLVIPLYFQNSARGHSLGGEAFATWKIAGRWKLIPWYSFSHVIVAQGAVDINGTGNTGGTTPRNQFGIRSQIDLPRRFEWDTTLTYMGALRDGGGFPAYTRLDVRLGRHFGESAEISLNGDNLLTPRHAEFYDDSGAAHTLVARSIFARVTFRF